MFSAGKALFFIKQILISNLNTCASNNPYKNRDCKEKITYRSSKRQEKKKVCSKASKRTFLYILLVLFVWFFGGERERNKGWICQYIYT